MKKKSLGVIFCTFMLIMLFPNLAYGGEKPSESDCDCSINDFQIHFMNEDLEMDTTVDEQGETVHSIQVPEGENDPLSLVAEGTTEEINCPKGLEHKLTYKFKEESQPDTSYQLLESMQDIQVSLNTGYVFKVSAEGIAEHHYIYVKFVSSTSETQPSIQIDYANEKLTGFDDGSYTVNGAEVRVSEGTTVIDHSWLGTEISIVKKGDGTTTTDSIAQKLTIPAKPEKPIIQISKTEHSITVIKREDSPICEYSIDGTNWQDDPTFTELNSGTTYKVYARVKGTEESFCSDSTMVTTITEGTSLGNGALSGTVMDESSSKISEAVVKVTKKGTNGRVIAETTSDGEGKYKFDALPYSVYSLVVTKDNQTATKTIRVNKASIIQDITLLSGKKDTLVEVKGTTPPVAADNLDKMFTAEDAEIAKTGIVKIKLVVEKKEENSIPSNDKSKVEESLSSGKKVGIYLDAQLLKTVIGNTEKIQPPNGQKIKITIDIPKELLNKAPYSIIRVHEGEALKISPEYDNKLQTLTFDADKFSTYAIAYTDGSSSSSSKSSGNSRDYDDYIITAKAEQGGSISPSGDISVREGKNETFTMEPQKGYIIKDVLVDGKSVGAVESYVFRDVRNKHTIRAIFEEKEENKEDIKIPFEDIKEDDWFYHDVLEVYGDGLMQGVSENKFGPQISTSRGMIATIVYRLDGSTEMLDSKFPDVAKGQYCYNAIGWAEKYAVVKGYGNGMYGPNDTITREQLVAILWRYAGSPMLMDYEGLTEFSDVTEISQYAQPAMAWAYEKGIIFGKGNNILDPKGLATRAEVAKIIVNFIKVK